MSSSTNPSDFDRVQILGYIHRLGDEDLLRDILDSTTDRLTQTYLSRLGRMLSPAIEAFLHEELGAGTASHLVLRAATFTPTLRQSLTVRYSSQSIYLNATAGPTQQVSACMPQLAVPTQLVEEVDEIAGLLSSITGGILPGHELYLRLP